MKKLLVTAALLSSTSLPVLAQDLNPQPLPPMMYASDVPSDFYFSLEAVAMGRSGTDTELYFDATSTSNVSTRDLAASLGWGGGMKFSVGGNIDGAWGFDLSGLGVGSFTASALLEHSNDDINAIYSDTVTAGNLDFSNSEDAHAIRLSESSELASIEASATYDMGGFKLFFGPRLLRYQASLGTIIYDELGDLQGTDNGIDTVNISSTNTLVGAQIGVSGMYALNDTFSVGGKAALGLYANYSTLNRSYNDGGSGNSPFTAGGAVSSTSSATGFAQSIEISPRINVALTDNLDLTLGTTWLWLNGVDEPGTHYTGIGAAGGGGGLAADSPTFANGVNFGGVTAGLHGQF